MNPDLILSTAERHHVVLWRVWRDAAIQESRALRRLPPHARTRPLDLIAALDDYLYHHGRVREIERARRYRARKRDATI